MPLQVLVEEKLAERSDAMGRLLRTQLQAIQSPRITQVPALRAHCQS